MEILTNNNPPMYERVETPTFYTTYDKDKYYAGEHVKFREGFSGLTGEHYMYLQYLWIPVGTDGKVERPIWRDVDSYIFETIREGKKTEKNVGVFKRREVGFTCIGAIAMPIHTIVTNPGAKCLITSKDQGTIAGIFSDKLMVSYDNLVDEDIKPDELKRNETLTSSYLETKQFVKIDGQVKVRKSKIICRETSNTTQSISNFSSHRAKYGFYDELPLHSRPEQLINSSRACYMESTKKTGFVLWGGTVEESVPIENILYLQKIRGGDKKEGEENISTDIVIFIEPWQGLKEFMVNGHSDKVKGMEWWDKRVSDLEKLGDPVKLLSFMKQYPPTLDAALGMMSNNGLPQDILDLISKQELVITNR